MAAARDFKHRAQGPGAKRSRKNEGAGARIMPRPADERGPRQSSRHGRATLFALGLLLGFAAGIGVMVFDVPDRLAELNQAPLPIDDDGHGGPASAAAEAERAKVEFEFYDNLPEITVVLDAQDLEPPTAAPEPPRPPTPSTIAPTPQVRAADGVNGTAPVRQAVASPVPSEPAPKPRVEQRPAPAAAPTTRSTPAATVAATPANTQSRYLMQVASFRRLADAEKTRAELGFSGLRARIVSVSLDDGSQRHRVQLEPFEGEARLKAIRKAVKLHGFSEPLVVRVKQG